jgi:hypothetical protein
MHRIPKVLKPLLRTVVPGAAYLVPAELHSKFPARLSAPIGPAGSTGSSHQEPQSVITAFTQHRALQTTKRSLELSPKPRNHVLVA